MKIVGLTGGIGSGKSTVAEMFKELGIPVYDSDLEAKQLMVNSQELKEGIVGLLGKNAYVDGKLNRSFIAETVFNDPKVLQKLNTIVHPAVRAHFLEWAEEQTAPYVIQETALIFENGHQDRYDYTILVTAPLATRLQRVMKRDRAQEHEVLDRIKNQLEDDTKIEMANFHIENIDLETTKNKVKELHAKLLEQAKP
ncbi:MAG: dephospho-CoA kinase [Allomuricauda sp.]